MSAPETDLVESLEALFDRFAWDAPLDDASLDEAQDERGVGQGVSRPSHSASGWSGP